VFLHYRPIRIDQSPEPLNPINNLEPAPGRTALDLGVKILKNRYGCTLVIFLFGINHI
jgi:hypothetical protein